MRDVYPYFGLSWVILIAHIIYAYTGNMLLTLWLIYLAPIINFLFGVSDN
jgi:alkane 1-monooxygenase